MLAKSLAAALAAVVAGSIACGGTRTNTGALPNTHDAFLVVTNDYLLDVNVYALRSGVRQRLGTVRGMKTDTLNVGQIAAGGQVRLLAEPVATNERHVSDAITVGPGDWIEFTVRNPLNLSTVAVVRPNE